jgi:lysophospholipase L1-like esterase
LSRADSGVHYYVSLGDSFSVGVQPIGQPPLFETDEGYADQLYRLLHRDDPKLALVKLGCGGESTRSMRFGSVDPSEGFSCGPPGFYLHRYPHKTQLAEAVAFLHGHRNHVSLVTIDIGGNDVLGGGGGVPQVEANLPVILSDLREAAGRESQSWA